LNLFDSPLKEKLQEIMYFAGGCIYCLNNDKPPKDYDIFLMDGSLIDELKQLNIWSYISEYALTYGRFQIVIKYYGRPESCVGQFDFKHNMYYYIPFSSRIHSVNLEDCFSEFDDYEFLNSNELMFNEDRARDIEGVYLRIEKFVNRGMTISAETKKKIKKRTTKKRIKEYKSSKIGGKSHY
jgi:hypothetical protein